MKTIASLSACLALTLAAAMPGVALAYLTPDQVFGGQSLNLRPAPPNPREGESVIEAQQRRSAEFREEAQKSLESVDEEPQDDYMHPAAAPEPRGLFDQEAQYEKRMERIEQTHSAAPTIIIGAEGTVVDSHGNVLHSGAPRIVGTGPESALAALSMVLAGISTFGLLAYRSRRLHHSLSF